VYAAGIVDAAGVVTDVIYDVAAAYTVVVLHTYVTGVVGVAVASICDVYVTVLIAAATVTVVDVVYGVARVTVMVHVYTGCVATSGADMVTTDTDVDGGVTDVAIVVGVVASMVTADDDVVVCVVTYGVAVVVLLML